jgi:hypothetical protein
MVAKEAGIKVAQILCDQDTFDVIADDKYVRCFMNGIPVIASKDIGSFAPVVAMTVMSSLKVPNTFLSIKSSQAFADFLKGILDTVSKSDQVKVQVLDEKPDEIADQKPKQAELLNENLDGFKNNVKTTFNCFNDVLSLSDILLKTKLPKNVLAFKDLNNTLSKVRSATMELEKSKDLCDLMVERIGIHTGRVILARENNLNDPNVKRTVQESVDYMAADFMAMKKLLASLVLSHYPLYDINPTFKKYTDYPATWFFDPSVFYNFSERYKDASDNLIDIVRAEASVINPLYAWFQSTHPQRERHLVEN